MSRTLIGCLQVLIGCLEREQRVEEVHVPYGEQERREERRREKDLPLRVAYLCARCVCVCVCVCVVCVCCVRDAVY